MTETTWSLAALELPDGSERIAALTSDGSAREFEAVPNALALIDLIRAWDKFQPLLRSFQPDSAKPLRFSRVLAPLRYPNKVICVGANYRDHRKEMSTSVSSADSVMPFFFMKPPTTTIVGPSDHILIRGDADRVDWEAEVAIVIGKPGRFIRKEQALDYVAGYTLLNDVSARGAHARENPIHPAFAFDWCASKAQDTFCPLGPGVVPAWLIPDPDDISFSLTVNGVTEQSATTADQIADMRTLIVTLSELMTLEPGDIIATGTPSGVGAAKGRFLLDGDVVTMASPLLGSFSNTVKRLAPVTHDSATQALKSARAL